MHGLTGGGWKRGNLRHRASPLPSQTGPFTGFCHKARDAGPLDRMATRRIRVPTPTAEGPGALGRNSGLQLITEEP